jgi:SAM-dependent methyltransferase
MEAMVSAIETTAEATFEPQQVEEFMGRLMGIYSGSMLSYMIDIGTRTGLFTAAAAGPATSAGLAERAGLTERYVREWLAAMVTAGIFEYDPATETYTLPPAHAAALTPGPMNLAPFAQFNTHLGKHVHQVAHAFRAGGGVPYAEYRPEFMDVMDGISRGMFDTFLLDAYLPTVSGLVERLQEGTHVADVACGAGHALVLLARAFPQSTFVGYDLDEGAIARARAEARGAELDNVSFEVRDVARLSTETPFGVVFVFDALHDQVDPAGVLSRIFDALEPGGVLVMKEPRGADTLEGNIGNPMAPILYSVSTLHCMTVSLAHDGAGIGTMMPERLARDLLRDAGFVEVSVHETPGDPADALYVALHP